MIKLDRLYSKKQQEVLRETHKKDWFMVINHGAKRSGKTIINNDLFLMELRRIKKIADSLGIDEPMYILAGVSSKTIQNNILTELSNKYAINFKFDRHSSFKLLGVKVVQAFTGTISGLGGIRGMTAFGAYINEASLAKKEVFSEIVSRCSGEGARILVDTNPDNPEHWLLKDYIKNPDPNILSFKYVLDDNSFLSDRYIRNIKASTPKGMFYERDIYGNWVSGEGVVYKDFDPKVHYVNDLSSYEFISYFVGVDWGYEHYGVIVVFGESSTGEYVMVDEIARQGEEIDFWVRKALEVKERYGNIAFYCDSARTEHIARFKREGLAAFLANKEVIAGIEDVATMFKTNNLKIYEPCAKRFKEEIYSYVRDDKSGEDKVKKENDDVMDAMRYAIHSKNIVERARKSISERKYKEIKKLFG